MTTSLGGSSGITFPDNTNLPVGKVSTIFTPKITNTSNQTKILGNVEISGDLGVGLYDRVTHNSACRTYTITLKAEQSGDNGTGHARAKFTGHGSAQGTTTSGSGMLTDPAMKISPDTSLCDYSDFVQLGDITERPPGYFAFRNFNVYRYLWRLYPSGVAGEGMDPLLNGIPSFINALQNDIPVKIIVNIESGVVVGSDAWNRYALDTTPTQYFPGNTPLAYPSGSRCEINLAPNSYIVGKGGNGSNYYRGGGGGDFTRADYAGGVALRVTIPTKITNNGTIAKGGGGSYAVSVPPGYNNSGIVAGGAGGAGFYVGVAEPSTSSSTFGTSQNGTLLTGGLGYGIYNGYPNQSGRNLGVDSFSEAYLGTQPAITGGSLITFALQGTVLGPITG